MVNRNIVRPDEVINNADWTKTEWDLPKYKSEKFYEQLEFMGITLGEFRRLPVYEFNLANGTIKE